MGKFLSKFRKEKTTYQKLEGIEENIKKLEAYTVSTQQRQKRFVGNLLITSIGIYVVAFIVFYFAFFPPTWEKRILHSIPLLLFPFIIFFLKQLVAFYFQRKLNKNSDRLSDLRAEKKKLLAQVMEKETYNVALEILNKFGDRTQLKPFVTPIQNTPKVTPVTTKSTNMTPKSALPSNTSTFLTPRGPLQNINANTLQQRLNTPVNANNTNINRTFESRPHLVPSLQSKRTPYPIIDPEKKNVLDKMVDYLIGDGPTNRFAMICKECYRHNGMALQEDYEYSAFRCAFCNFLNPAKKLRPVAPKLQSEISTSVRRLSTSSSTSDSDSNSKETKRDSDEVPAAEVTDENQKEQELPNEETETAEEPAEKPPIQKKLE